MPEPELRNIIDKTAAYVLKNGKEFEEILRTKNDVRFAFLKYTDQYYRYYVHKVTGAICSAPPKTAPPPPDTNATKPQPPKEVATPVPEAPKAIISNYSSTRLKCSFKHYLSILSFRVVLHQTQRRPTAEEANGAPRSEQRRGNRTRSTATGNHSHRPIDTVTDSVLCSASHSSDSSSADSHSTSGHTHQRIHTGNHPGSSSASRPNKSRTPAGRD